MKESKKQQVIALGRLGWSLRRIQKSTGVRRETAAAYLKEAGVAVRPPGAWGRAAPAKPANEVTPDSNRANSDGGAAEEALGPKPANEVTPDSEPANAPDAVAGAASPKPANEVTADFGAELSAAPNHRPSASACEVHREAVEVALSLGRNAKAIFQDLVDAHGFTGSYQSVKRFMRKIRGSQPPEARVVIQTAAGEEAQVDYGSGPMVRDATTGKYRRTRLFALTLGYRRKAIHLLVFRSSAQVWAELHEKAFRRLGGTTRVIVLDNLGEGVLTPDVYDPAINPLYRDVLQHYRTVAMPCRVADPDRKGKVERSVGYAKNTPLKGLRFESLAAAQAYLDHWEEHWADTRIHGTTKRQVAAMFAEEKPALQPLPLEPFRYYQYGTRTVHLDGCVEVEAAYYGAPPGWITRRVHVQWDNQRVRLLNPETGELLREHLRQARGGHRIKDEDRPKQTPLGILQLLARADKAGSQIGALCRTLHQKQGDTAVRRIHGVLSLAKKYGPAIVDDACAAVLEMGSCEYHSLRRYLERQPQLPLSLRQVNPLIRQLTLYRDFIESKTKESEL